MTFDQKMRFLTLAFDENNVPFAGRRYTLTEADAKELEKGPLSPYAARIYGIELLRPRCKACGRP